MAEQTEVAAQSDSAESTRGRPRTRVGLVTSNKMKKTVVVTVMRRDTHPRYGKIISVRKRYKAHVEDHSYPESIVLNVGDQVRIAESRPLSKDKRWRVVEVLRKSAGV